MPPGSKVEKAENAMRAEYGTGKKADRIIYGRLNNIGLKSGNKTTAKGRQKASSRKR
jgi:hypothetical protein